jgi:hypothetical protein
MRSTIAIFVLVFAVVGLLLGFAELYDTQPIKLLKGTEYSLTFRNNSGEPCDYNSTDCFAVYQKP